MKKIVTFVALICIVFTYLYAEEGNIPQPSSVESSATTSETVIAKEEPQKYTLIYKFPQGKEIYYKMTMDRKDQFNIGGRKVDARKKTVIYTSQLFEGVDENGNGIIKMTYLQGWVDNTRIFPQAKEVKIKMSPKGEILESEGFQDIAAEFLKVIQYNLADYIPGIDRLPVKIDFSKMPSNTFNIYYQGFIFPVSETPVAVGDIWTKRDRNIGTIKYKLQKVEDGKAYVAIFAGASEEISSGFDGNAIFDIEGGYLISSDVKAVTDATGKIVQRAAKKISAASGIEISPASALPEKTYVNMKVESIPAE